MELLGVFNLIKNNLCTYSLYKCQLLDILVISHIFCFWSLFYIFYCIYGASNNGHRWRPTKGGAEGVDTIAATGFGKTKLTPLSQQSRLLKKLTVPVDLLYIYSTPLPFATIVLSRARSVPGFSPQPHLPLPKRLQKLLRTPH